MVLLSNFLMKQGKSRVAALLEPIGKREHVSTTDTFLSLPTLGLAAFSARGSVTYNFLISLPEVSLYLSGLIHSVACQDDDKEAHVKPVDVVVKLLSVLSIQCS